MDVRSSHQEPGPTSPPVAWGIALDRRGDVLVACKDGRVRCFGAR